MVENRWKGALDPREECYQLSNLANYEGNVENNLNKKNVKEKKGGKGKHET